MVKSKLCASVYTAIVEVIQLARRHDIACLARDSGLFRNFYSATFTTEDIEELQALDVIILIVRGKVTKSNLTDEQRVFFKSEVHTNNKHVLGSDLRDV